MWTGIDDRETGRVTLPETATPLYTAIVIIMPNVIHLKNIFLVLKFKCHEYMHNLQVKSVHLNPYHKC